MPTQEVPGTAIRYDFNNGARVVMPKGEHPWKVRLTDLDTGNILFETTFEQGTINSSKRYYIRFKLEIFQQEKQLLNHEYSAKDREILIQFPVGTLGDTMGWFPYAVKFQKLHGCKLTCAMGEKLIPLFAKAYPHIEFVSHEGVKAERYYATYSIGLFFDDKDFIFSRATSASSASTARRATSWASIRPRSRRGSISRTTRGRSRSPTSSSPRRARRSRSTGTIRKAGAPSSRC